MSYDALNNMLWLKKELKWMEMRAIDVANNVIVGLYEYQDRGSKIANLSSMQEEHSDAHTLFRYHYKWL